MTFRDLPLAVECFAALAWARVALRVMPHRVLRGVLEEREGGGEADGRVVDVFRRVCARSPIAHTCMHRALALRAVLTRRGVGTRLRIGIGRRPQLFPGHAWLESNGAVINDDPEVVRRYEPLHISESALRAAYTS